MSKLISKGALRPILTAAEMRACDEFTVTERRIPSRTLMERAAGAAVDYLLRRTDLFPCGRVLFLCGNGNNGGDGFAAARLLADGSRGETRDVSVIYTGRWSAQTGAPDETAMSVECARQYRLLRESGVVLRRPDDIASILRDCVAVVDAMLGIGLESPVRGAIPEIIEAVRRVGLPVLAVDMPTGIHADSGAIMGMALPARATVTMQALKAGLLLYPGADFCGEIAVGDIGVELTPAAKPFAYMADETLLRRILPPRSRHSHKGTYGRVLAVCGSVGMSGAAVLCAASALRTGAGLVEVLTPEENRLVVQVSLPEAIVTPYETGKLALGSADTSAVERRATLRHRVREAVSRASVVVMGCGLGTSEESRFILSTVLEALESDRVPLVLDADALNLLAEDASLWETRALATKGRRVVITPHPAEMARLSVGESVTDILADPFLSATRLAARRGVTVVLKDAHTVIASTNGATGFARAICPFGNAGMATGGSGDALAGVIASLLGQIDPREAAPNEIAAAGVYLHAAAGDRTAERLGEAGMLPSDLIREIPLILKDFSDSTTRIEGV